MLLIAFFAEDQHAFVAMRCLTFLWLVPEAEKGPWFAGVSPKRKEKGRGEKKKEIVLGALFAVCLMWHGWEGKVKLLLYAIGMLTLHLVSHYCCHQI